MSDSAFWMLLLIFGLGRLVEIGISRRNQRQLARQGVAKIAEPHFPWMVLLHLGVFIGAGLEVEAFHRPFIPALGIPMALLFAFANILRWWVIRTLAGHWNVQVMASTPLGVITTGPYRWVRHPNYVAVFIELLALPLIHTAWLTAAVGSAMNLWVLSRRVAVEEAVLLADPVYRKSMATKPRFFPRRFGP